MQFIKELFSVNEILTVSIMSWFVAQVLKTIINFILLGKFQLERMWGDGGMPSVAGTRCTRCTPDSYFKVPYTLSPVTEQIIS